jgi:multidrug resistance efflux pump
MRFAVSSRKLIACLGLAPVGVLVFAGARSLVGLADAPVATIEATKSRFVREVRAAGVLKAVRATPIVVPAKAGRWQRVAFVIRDGAPVKAGETVVRFDPFESEKETADGRADLEMAQRRLEKTKAEGDKNRRSLALDRDLAAAELDRARTFVPTDEGVFSRHEIIEAGIDRTLFEKKASSSSRKLETSAQLSAADVALGEIEAGKAILKVRQAERSLSAVTSRRPTTGC